MADEIFKKGVIASAFNDFCILLLFLIPQSTVGETEEQTSDCDTYRRDTQNTERGRELWKMFFACRSISYSRINILDLSQWESTKETHRYSGIMAVKNGNKTILTKRAFFSFTIPHSFVNIQVSAKCNSNDI